MITKVQTIAQLKQLFLEIFINKTDKVSDISDNSVVNATAYGVAKVAQKCIKDIAIVESHIFPDSASGSYLDSSATLFGVPSRKLTASSSSTYIRLVAEPGTQYFASTHTFQNYNGIRFVMDSDVTIGDFGYEYVKVRSVDLGSKTNVDPNSIITLFDQPVGHIGVTNEYRATGGSDIESDEMLRMRVKKHLNILARNTIAYFTEVIRMFDDDILKVVNLGNNDAGKRVLGLVHQNGITLSGSELASLLENTTPYFPITDINLYGGLIGIEFANIEWYNVDMDFRVYIADNYDPTEVRKEIQVNLSKYLDFRYWEVGRKVEWDDLLQVVKGTEGVRYVPDQYFVPATDLQVPVYKLPRIRGFIMKNLEGSMIFDNPVTGNPLTQLYIPIYYPVGYAS